MGEGLETRVRELEIDKGKQEVINANVADALNKNTVAIQELTTVLNKSKGAWWALGALAAAVGYVLSLVTQWVKS